MRWSAPARARWRTPSLTSFVCLYYLLTRVGHPLASGSFAEVFPAFPDDERRPVSMPVDAEASIDAARALAGR